MSDIKLNQYSTVRNLEEAALSFATQRLARAVEIVAKCNGDRADRLRRKFAASALRDCQSQIKAALALLTMED